MSCEAIDEIVLAAVRLVSNHDYVATLGKPWFPVILGRHELLDGREDDVAGRYGQSFLQILPISCLFGHLPQKFMTSRERPKELIIQVVSICNDNDRRIL